MTCKWHAVIAWLQTEHATKMCRVTDRSADIAANIQRRHAAGDRCRTASAAATGSAIQIPGIIGTTKQRTIGLLITRQLGSVGLPHNNCPSLAESRHNRCILLGDIVSQWLETTCCS